MTYRPDIDGLRGLAVALVVIFHANSAWLSGGFVGVDVFFVVSGYLITRLILTDLDDGVFVMSGFLVRRLRRLYPALATMLLLCSLPGLFFFLPRVAEDLGESLATAALFLSNFLFFTEDGYFEGPSKLKPFIHTWSLAIEEQYYLLFPLALAALHRSVPSKLLVFISLALVLSLLLSVFQTEAHPHAAYFLLPSRAWELLVGASLAIYVSRSEVTIGPSIAAVLFTGGALLILGSATFLTEADSFPGINALPACAGTALCLFAAPSTRLSAVLQSGPLYGLGQISYSLYLWHWPIFVYRDYIFPTATNLWLPFASIVLALAFAWLSWRFVEKPFRGARGAFTNQQFVKACGCMCFVLVGIGLLLDQTDGLPARLPEDLRSALSAESLASSSERRCVGIAPEDVSKDTLCALGAIGEPTFILWGDSHAASIAPSVDILARDMDLAGLSATIYGCPPLLGVDKLPFNPKRPCQLFNDAVYDVIRTSNIEHVLIFARWAGHAEGGGYGAEGGGRQFLQTSSERPQTHAQNIGVFSKALEQTLVALNKLGVSPTIILSTPVVGYHVPQAVLTRQRLGLPVASLYIPIENHVQRQANVNQIFRHLSSEHELTVLSPNMCQNERCDLIEGQVPLYSDTNHLSVLGIERIKPTLQEALNSFTLNSE